MKKVLVVDDTKNIRLLLSKCLELEAYEVKTAVDGQNALEMLHAEPFDLAFLDIRMPKMSGTEVLKRIREIGITTPIIIITAYPTIKNAIECTNMGAVSYLQKPFTSEKIRSLLKELNCSVQIANEPFKDNELKEIIDNCLLHENFTKALNILKKALSHNPLDPIVYQLLGKVYELSGNNEKSAKFNALYNTLINFN